MLFIQGDNAIFQTTKELASLEQHSQEYFLNGIIYTWLNCMVCKLNSRAFLKKVQEKTYFNVSAMWTAPRCVVTTNGGRNMCGAEKSLVGLIYKTWEDV